ncbi:MAG TPA: hypothetical protein VFS75_00280 [Candidatus Paceibacterota bacterium]|nr:hypothetical protein [Candidatus Paceibacterota bacterium]
MRIRMLESFGKPEMSPLETYVEEFKKDYEELTRLAAASAEHAAGLGYGTDRDEKAKEMRERFEAMLEDVLGPKKEGEGDAQSELTLQ